MSESGLVGVRTDQPMSHEEVFARDGFVGPVKLMSQQQAAFLARHLLSAPAPGRRPVWEKSLATIDPLAYAAAVNPLLLRLVRDFIGSDVILWGASLVVRRPGETHTWHCDIESCAPDGGFVSAWIGLLNTRQESSLRLIPGSHAYGACLQEAASREGIVRKDRTDDSVSRLANLHKPGAEIVQPRIGNGEAILFDGRIWHGSSNEASGPARVALLLQYARADIAVKVPDLETLEWPFRFKQDRPPAIAVSGQADETRNHLVPPPAMRRPSALATTAHLIDPASRCEEGKSFTPVHCFLGHTVNVDFLECHYSILMPGSSPHLPHAHLDEEILVVMSGAAELVLADSPRDTDPRIISAPAGSAIYYPPYRHHTIRNVSREPVRYAMLRWRSPVNITAVRHLPPHFVRPDWLQAGSFRGAVSMQTLFEGPSAFLGKLHAHVTRILPGGSYQAHRDAHDVSIFLIEGEIAVLGKNIVAPAIVFIPAGHLHDMKALGDTPAKYVVWEFHRSEREHVPAGIRKAAQAPAALDAR